MAMNYMTPDRGPNRGPQKGQFLWTVIQPLHSADGRPPTKCQLCTDTLEKITTASLKDGAKRYACTWCGQRYNVTGILAPEEKPDATHPDFGVF